MGKSLFGQVANFDNVLLKCLSLDGSMENPASTEKVRQLRKEKSISIRLYSFFMELLFILSIVTGDLFQFSHVLCFLYMSHSFPLV